MLHRAIRMINDDVAVLTSVLRKADRVDLQFVPKPLLTKREEIPLSIRSWPDLNSWRHAHCFARQPSRDRVVTTKTGASGAKFLNDTVMPRDADFP